MLSDWLKTICANTGNFGVKLWHAYLYYRVRGHWPNFRKPKDLSEHILSAMNHKSFERFANLADKVKVRDYIKAKGLSDILLEVYGVWEHPEDIDFDKLPDKFALKPNNGCGGHFFCKDKSGINRDAVIKQLNDSLESGKTAFRFERHYSKIEPRIYCEELIDTGSEAMPTDYKFMCIKGQIAFILVITERGTGHAMKSIMNTDWQELPYTQENHRSSVIPAKPVHLDRMIEIAKKLSEDFEYVRVDLYEYKNKVFFGELTFSPAGGILYSHNNRCIKEVGKLFDE